MSSAGVAEPHIQPIDAIRLVLLFTGATWLRQRQIAATRRDATARMLASEGPNQRGTYTPLVLQPLVHQQQLLFLADESVHILCDFLALRSDGLVGDLPGGGE